MSPSGWPAGPSGGESWPPSGGQGGWPAAGGAPTPPPNANGPAPAGWGGNERPAQSAGWGSGGPAAGWGGRGGQPDINVPGTATVGDPAWPGAGPRAGSWVSGSGPSWTPTAGEITDPSKARPPLLWLWLAIAGPVVGLALLAFSGWGWHIAGWAVAVFVGLGLLVVFTSTDLRRRASPWYLPRPGLVGVLRLVVAAAAIIVAGIHAYYFADYIARLDFWA